MLDAILDLFDRRRKEGDTRRSGGVLDRLGGLVAGDDDDRDRDRDRRPYPDRRDDRWSDDDAGWSDDDRDGRRRAERRGDGDGFDFG